MVTNESRVHPLTKRSVFNKFVFFERNLTDDAVGQTKIFGEKSDLASLDKLHDCFFSEP